ncbi:hypothetical protein EUTSA_v10022204mg [Eutrema salsugineum]|uniref:Uncharacterized protein n=1 Tax=Eutrema salsugineum TaxID=72664 RepID=V4M0W0_EUTSA|nr:uncharacterized protein LOC18023303 [Eutrema salsugineum]ESQ48447.1 hypothetical protein EUTSA_v10022204mg [Eutrema salsugineum]
MSIRFMVKRLATVTVSKTHGGDVSGYVLRQAPTRFDRFFTAFRPTENMKDRHYEQGSNIANDDRSTTSYVTDKAKEGVKKATDVAINAGDNMKDAMDGAWKAAKETGQNISEAVAGDDDDGDRIQEDKVAVELKDVSQPVDTTEYRGVEDLHQQTDAENKSA